MQSGSERKEIVKPIPFLLLSDSVDTHSGLGRITRDLAYGLSKMPEFRVATVGRGGRGTSKMPFLQYYIPNDGGWGEEEFGEIWRDFASGDKGIVFTIWDASRVRYLVDEKAPGFPRESTMDFQRWGYFPVDSSGPNGKLTGVLADTISRFNRVLTYGLWAKELVERSIGRPVDWIPHGINMDTFQPRDPVGARLSSGFGPEHKVIGMVATNQTRKDWGLAMLVISELIKQRPNVRFWVHIDELIRHWNIPALVIDYNLHEYVKVTTSDTMTDTQLSWLYSACDLTILPSSEGFGYPLAESMACGTPAIHSNYAGGAEIVSPHCLVEVNGMRIDGIYNCVRPTWSPADWIARINKVLDGDNSRAETRRYVEHLDWPNLWPVFKKWFLKGLTNEKAG